MSFMRPPDRIFHAREPSLLLDLVSLLLCSADKFQAKCQPSQPALPEPEVRPFRGTIHLRVDARDTAHSIFRVTESIPLQAAGDLVLFYPEWETTSHAPTVSAIELAGL